jgi:hypothetical protein
MNRHAYLRIVGAPGRARSRVTAWSPRARVSDMPRLTSVPSSLPASQQERLALIWAAREDSVEESLINLRAVSQDNAAYLRMVGVLRLLLRD